MYKDLGGKTAVVTGSGKRTGIGYAIAEKMAFCGANVVIADLGIPAQPGVAVKMGGREEMESIAADLAEKYRVETLTIDLDVTNSDSIKRMAETVKVKFGSVDALFNNAGATFGSPSPAHLYDEGAWLRTVDVNLHGTFRVSKALLPMMFGRAAAMVKSPPGRGRSLRWPMEPMP